MTPALQRIQPYLPEGIYGVLAKNSDPKKWIHALERQPEYLLVLYNAIKAASLFHKDDELYKIAKKVKEKLGDKCYEVKQKVEKVAPVVQSPKVVPRAPAKPQPVVPHAPMPLPPKVAVPPLNPEGLENLGNSCWMNSMLQIIRRVPTYASMYDLNIAPHDFLNENERGQLINLQQALHAAALARPATQEQLTTLRQRLYDLNYIQNVSEANDALEVLSHLQQHLGQVPVIPFRNRIQFQVLAIPHLVADVEQDFPMNLVHCAVHENQPLSRLIGASIYETEQSEVHGERFIVTDNEDAKKIADYADDYNRELAIARLISRNQPQTNQAILEEQMATIREEFQEPVQQGAATIAQNAHVHIANAISGTLHINALPAHFEVRCNRLGNGNPLVEPALDLGPLTDVPNAIRNYDLQAVICHQGANVNNFGGGHYYCYALDRAQNQWIQYNDRMVTAVTNQDAFADFIHSGYEFLYGQRP
jgi:hypothetical protein